jgi:hypothetical protein
LKRSSGKGNNYVQYSGRQRTEKTDESAKPPAIRARSKGGTYIAMSFPHMTHEFSRSAFTDNEKRVPLSEELSDIEMFRCATIQGPWRVLAVGETQDTDRVVQQLIRDYTGPVREFRPDNSLPARLDGLETLIIRDVEQLTRTQQETLLQFITLHPLVSIIALSSQSLWRCVQAGEFSETLFYRLNVLTIVATGETPAEEGIQTAC